MVEKQIIVSVPPESLEDPDSPAGKIIKLETSAQIREALEGMGVISDKDKTILIDSYKRPVKIITTYGRGTEPFEAKYSLEVLDITNDN